MRPHVILFQPNSNLMRSLNCQMFHWIIPFLSFSFNYFFHIPSSCIMQEENPLNLIWVLLLSSAMECKYYMQTVNTVNTVTLYQVSFQPWSDLHAYIYTIGIWSIGFTQEKHLLRKVPSLCTLPKCQNGRLNQLTFFQSSSKDLFRTGKNAFFRMEDLWHLQQLAEHLLHQGKGFSRLLICPETVSGMP